MNNNRPFFSKFNRITYQIQEDLPETQGVPDNVAGNIWMHVKHQFNSLFLGLHNHNAAEVIQTFIKITMPYMLFVTAPHLITSFIHNMNNFNVIYLLTSTRITSDQLLANANASDTDLLITWLFKLTQDYYNYKMASVIGIVIFLLSALFTLIAFNYTIRADKENRFQ